MFYCNTTGQYIQEGTAFEINGIQYPANWLNHASPEEKSAIGLEEVIATNARGDDRYYWVSETFNGPDLTFINTPKELKDDPANNGIGLITTCTNQIIDTSYKLMLPTDWMIIRKTERGVDVPSDVSNTRIAIITECNRLIDSLANTANVEMLITVMNSQNWPTANTN
jgi:hypothetical protein